MVPSKTDFQRSVRIHNADTVSVRAFQRNIREVTGLIGVYDSLRCSDYSSPASLQDETRLFGSKFRE